MTLAGLLGHVGECWKSTMCALYPLVSQATLLSAADDADRTKRRLGNHAWAV